MPRLPRALDVLRQEHRQMSQRLNLLEGQLDLLELNLETNSELLLQITGFFRSYPDLYHHPKEELLLARLAEVAPEAARELFGIPSEHQKAALELVGLSHALKSMLREPERARERFHAAAKTFADNERRHMRWEEKCFLRLCSGFMLNAGGPRRRWRCRSRLSAGRPRGRSCAATRGSSVDTLWRRRGTGASIA